MSYALGQTVELVFTTSPAETGTLTVTRPDGTAATAVVSGVAGAQTALVEADQAGVWTYVWESPNAGQRVDSFSAGLQLVTVDQAKTYMGVTIAKHDEEIARYCSGALGVVEEMTGQTIVRRPFTERYTAAGRTLLLNRYPVVSVTSFSQVVAGVVTAVSASAYVADSNTVVAPVSRGTVELTYVAGLPYVPDECVDAALLYVSYRYRRNHGGSDSYMPSGVEGSTLPPMGTKALREQMRLALGPYVRGMRSA